MQHGEGSLPHAMREFMDTDTVPKTSVSLQKRHCQKQSSYSNHYFLEVLGSVFVEICWVLHLKSEMKHDLMTKNECAFSDFGHQNVRFAHDVSGHLNSDKATVRQLQELEVFSCAWSYPFQLLNGNDSC